MSDTNDTAFWSRVPGGAMFLADTHSAFVPPMTILAAETGFQSVQVALGATGFYTLGFGVVDVSDLALGSVLLVDNAQVVPEPSGLTVMGLGLAGVFRRLRRARRMNA